MWSLKSGRALEKKVTIQSCLRPWYQWESRACLQLGANWSERILWALQGYSTRRWGNREKIWDLRGKVQTFRARSAARWSIAQQFSVQDSALSLFLSRDWTQGFIHAYQLLSHLGYILTSSHPPPVLFWDGVSKLVAPLALSSFIL